MILETLNDWLFSMLAVAHFVPFVQFGLLLPSVAEPNQTEIFRKFLSKDSKT